MMQIQAKVYLKFLCRHPEIQQQVNFFAPAAARMFSTDAVSKNYDKFRRKYTENLAVFKEKVQRFEQENIISAKKPIKKGYSHPYHTDHHPLNFSPVKTAELFHDFVGPEQVSPHYENFLVARKYAMAFWAGLAIITAGVATVDIHWIMKSTLTPFVFWMSIMYMYLEGRKSFFKPLLVRFYRRVAANEIYNFEVFYHENIEVRMRELIRIAKSQLSFWQLHREYQDVKAESINNFLAAEYLNLQKNIVERTTNILKQAQIYEESNKTNFIQTILNEASSEIDKALAQGNNPEIQKKMLDSAIDGLSKGYMDYQNDPILPLVNGIIKKHVEKFNKLSDAEKSKLLSLTEAQIKSLRDSDQHAKHEFLTTIPRGLDGGLKNNEYGKKILSNWGH